MRELWKGKLKCECGALTEKTKIKIEGKTVRAWRCPKCGEETLHPIDAEKVLIAHKLRRGIKVKVGQLGRRLVVTIPQEIARTVGISKGSVLTAKIKKEREIALTQTK